MKFAIIMMIVSINCSASTIEQEFLTEVKNKKYYCMATTNRCYPLVHVQIKKNNITKPWQNLFSNGVLTIYMRKDFPEIAKIHEFSIIKKRLK